MADLVLSFRGEQVNVVRNIDKILVKLTQLEKKLAGVTVTSRTASTSLATMGKRAMTSVLRVGRAMARLTTMLGLGGLAGAFVISTKKAKDFETAMAEVGTLIVDDDRAVEKYSKKIRELSRDSSFAAAELSKGLYQVISAGVKGTEDAAGSMELLNVAQRAAVAGVTGVFESVDVLTTSLNAYGMSTDKAEHLSDVLFTTVRLGKTTFGELASQMGTVASVASVAGISFEEVNAAIVALTKAGLGTDLATTQLRATIVSFLKPTEALKAALGDPAKVLKERGLVGAMQMVKDYAQGDAAALTKLIPNIRAFNSVAILAGKGADGFKEALKEMQSATGASELAYAKMADTFAVKSKKLWNRISDTLISIGNKLMPILLRSLENFSEWVDNNQDDIVKFFENLLTYIGATLSAIKEVFKFAAAGVKAIMDLGKRAKDIVNAPFFGKSNEEIVRQKLKELKAIAPKATWGKRVLSQSPYGESKKRTSVEDDPLSRDELGAAAAAKARAAAMSAKLSQAEIDKIIADQKAALDVLHQLRIANMNKLERLKQKFHDDSVKLSEMNFKHESDLLKALELRKQKFLKDREKILIQLNTTQLEGVRRVLEAEEKRQEEQKEANAANLESMKQATAEAVRLHDVQKKYLRDQKEGADAALQSYKDMRAGWSSMAVSKWGKGEQRKEDESWDEYSKRLGEGGKSWLDSVSEGFTSMWDKVTTGFLERIGEKLFDMLEAGVNLLLTPLKKMYEPILTALSTGDKDATNAAIDDIIELFTKLAENLGPILENLIEEGIPKLINAIISALPAIIEAIFTYIPDLIVMIVQAIPKIIVVIIQKLPLIIKAIIGMIPEIIKAVVAMIPHIVGEFIKQIPMIAMALAKAVVDAVLGLIPGLKKGNKGGIFSGIGKGKGTSDNPLVTEEKKEVSVAAGNVEAMDETHLAALKSHFEESKGGPQKGESYKDYAERMITMRNRLIAQGVDAKLGPTDLFHRGGFVGRLQKAIKAHTGMFVMPSMGEDERLAVLQTGEGVLNREATAAAGGEAGINAMNAGGGGGITNLIWAPEHAFVEDSGEVIDRMQADMMNKKAGRVRKMVSNKIAGFKSRK